jgi:hypothetical protein
MANQKKVVTLLVVVVVPQSLRQNHFLCHSFPWGDKPISPTNNDSSSSNNNTKTTTPAVVDQTSSLVQTTTKPSSFLVFFKGASRGFGKALATMMCLEAPKSLLQDQVSHMHVILESRSADRLEEVGRYIMQQYSSSNITTKTTSKLKLQLSCHRVDFAVLELLEAQIDRIFQDIDLASFDQLIFINNHDLLVI